MERLLRVSALLLLLVPTASIPSQGTTILADNIVNLPGQPNSPAFKQYSGYLDASNGKKFHYWFIECETDKDTAPLVLWLNGGPGCSSLDGLLGENGPFRVNSDGKTLSWNPHSWNKIANMLYLETPAGVGYSYSDNGNYTTDDDTVAHDNYLALKFFFDVFPEFSERDFYLSGESYAGVYIPTLAARIAEDDSINTHLKGLLIGNAVSDVSFNDNSAMFYGYYHGLIGFSQWKTLVKHCCKDGDVKRCDFARPTNALCYQALAHSWSLRADVNPYNIYGGCHHPSQKHLKYFSSHFARRDAGEKTEQEQHYGPPCLSSELNSQYLNSDDVRRSLHIPEDLPPWRACSPDVGLSYVRNYNTMREVYHHLLSLPQLNYRILLYNGDADMVCNFLGEQWFVESLNLQVTNEYGPWYYTGADGSRQVAGFKKEFGKLSLATVLGAGHMVPTDKPVQALTILRSFLADQPL